MNKKLPGYEKEMWKPGNMVYPVPAVMVSCGEAGEQANIITVAWTGTVCSEPPMAYISVRKERYSHHLLMETGEFVINLTTRALAAATDYCGVRSGSKVNKWKETGLTQAVSRTVSAPSIAESPVNIECKVRQVLELGSHDMFLAEVTGVSAAKELLDDTGRLDLGRADLMAYSHGEYFALGELLGSFGYTVRKKK